MLYSACLQSVMSSSTRVIRCEFNEFLFALMAAYAYCGCGLAK